MEKIDGKSSAVQDKGIPDGALISKREKSPVPPRHGFVCRVIKFKNFILRCLSNKGFPLLEIVMVIVIFSFFRLIYLGEVFKGDVRTPAEKNIHRMLLLDMMIQTYHWSNSVFPPSLGELICEGRDRSSCIPVANPESLIDVWGTPYIYTHTPQEDFFTLKSLGADRKEGGEGENADIIRTGP